MPIKPVHPFANGFPAVDDATLREQTLDIRRTWREPNGMKNKLKMKPIARQARHFWRNFPDDRPNFTATNGKLSIPVWIQEDKDPLIAV